ncbi:TPA: hypothetical protein ACJIWA_001033 [Enterobacter bugandensis]|uniref:hypothetical protein n=1 Tax=Enterobacter TaxID=547 RepID=UPI001D0528E4|nr:MULTISPECIES: hypothetical protein [Enterobacter]MCK6701390.1 hypothetical protein [Enterobacter bugandensis]MCK6776348.1 hypothetical protein [Enterobacter bugandensis]MCM7373564.1 hypothetical protein [Enterobacter bugandensis]WNI57308.1 hypothetical protein RIK64_14445 [Enterobacter bugandensis]
MTDFAWPWNKPRPAIGAFTFESAKLAPLAGAVAHHPAVEKHIDRLIKRAGYNPAEVRNRGALIHAMDKYEPHGLPFAIH